MIRATTEHYGGDAKERGDRYDKTFGLDFFQRGWYVRATESK